MAQQTVADLLRELRPGGYVWVLCGGAYVGAIKGELIDDLKRTHPDRVVSFEIRNPEGGRMSTPARVVQIHAIGKDFG